MRSLAPHNHALYHIPIAGDTVAGRGVGFPIDILQRGAILLDVTCERRGADLSRVASRRVFCSGRFAGLLCPGRVSCLRPALDLSCTLGPHCLPG